MRYHWPTTKTIDAIAWKAMIDVCGKEKFTSCAELDEEYDLLYLSSYSWHTSTGIIPLVETSVRASTLVRAYPEAIGNCRCREHSAQTPIASHVWAGNTRPCANPSRYQQYCPASTMQWTFIGVQLSCTTSRDVQVHARS